MPEQKEEFCSTCAVGLAALVGAGTTGGSTKIQDKKVKKIMFWGGLIVTIISIIILIRLWLKGDCLKCSSSSSPSSS